MLEEYVDPPLITVKLIGKLGKKFTPKIQLRGHTTGDIIAGLIANFPDFKKYILNLDAQGFGYRVIRGLNPVKHEDELQHPIAANELIIAPIPMGSGGIFKGFGSILLGAALIAAGIFTGGTTIAILGASLVAGGIASFFSKKQSTPTSETSRDQSFLFDFGSGAGGHLVPIPCCYGRRMRQLTEEYALSQLIETHRIPITV